MRWEPIRDYPEPRMDQAMRTIDTCGRATGVALAGIGVICAIGDYLLIRASPLPPWMVTVRTVVSFIAYMGIASGLLWLALSVRLTKPASLKIAYLIQVVIVTVAWNILARALRLQVIYIGLYYDLAQPHVWIFIPLLAGLVLMSVPLIKMTLGFLREGRTLSKKGLC